MSSLVVKSPGLLTTVQDLGRYGYGAIGVSPAGAADPVALRLANLLVSNKPGAAALEMTLLGGSYVFPEGGVIAITGANMNPVLNGRELEMWATISVPRGAELTLGSTKNYARSYLAIAGGIRVKPFLGSASTHLLSGTGGFKGRALRKGDVLKFDRLGLRLDAPPIPSPLPTHMITEGVSLGAIQITPSGQAIILGVDQQTTGGYPKIASVIGVDLHRVGQLRPHIGIRFERTSLTVAHALWIERERVLNATENLLV